MTALLSRAIKLRCDRCEQLIPDDLLLFMIWGDGDQDRGDVCEPCAEEIVNEEND